MLKGLPEDKANEAVELGKKLIEDRLNLKAETEN